ncbi:MAG: hypothetical protein ACTSP8_09200 [Promethearchaeota archaeon]
MPIWDSKVKTSMEHLECIKCSTPHNLVPYSLSHSKLISSTTTRRTRTSTYNVHSIPVPICLQCQNQFDVWGKTKTLFTLLGIVGFFFFWLGGAFLILNMTLGSNEPMTLQILGVSIGIILFAIDIPLFILHKKKDSNPRKYMMMGPDLVPYIKPQNQLHWVKYEDWIRSLTTEQIMPTAILKHGAGKQRAYKKLDMIPKFEKMIYKYLIENRGKAFTARAITNRIIEKLFEESDKNFLKINAERILNRLGLQRKIIVVQRNEEFYYSVQ